MFCPFKRINWNMRPTAAAVLLLLVSCGPLSGTEVASAGSSVQPGCEPLNGDFETWVGDGPAHWELGPGGATWGVDFRAGGAAGNRWLTHACDFFEADQVRSAPIGVSAGARYAVAWSVAIALPGEADTHIAVEWYAASGRELGSAQVDTVTGTEAAMPVGTWRRRGGELEAPLDAASARVTIGQGAAGAAVFWYDNVRFGSTCAP